MMTLHVFFTLMLFAPIWFVFDPIMQKSGAWTNIACLFGMLFLSSQLVRLVADTG